MVRFFTCSQNWRQLMAVDYSQHGIRFANYFLTYHLYTTGIDPGRWYLNFGSWMHEYGHRASGGRHKQWPASRSKARKRCGQCCSCNYCNCNWCGLGRNYYWSFICLNDPHNYVCRINGAVDGARNRYFMSSGGSWCPSTATMVGFLASGGLWCPATAGTH